ncbi:MAG: GAF domain-containing protein [Methylomonas sp.]|jgi:PAS domain-containing protein|uniref:GAF domain-containing protein n=1 Tax=Methylomonas sp. TaxID=418 RepID=UPI0025EC5E79|nr:GAF domain-containing protein [Methylomonas sp.]MCK9605510.1 GAF domain-containing protein [Methylomonas sp.]
MEKANKLTLKLSRPFLVQFLKTYLFLALLTCVGAYCFYYSIQERISLRDKARESIGVELEREAVGNVFREINRDLRLITDHYQLKRILEHPSPEALHDFELDMLNLSAATKTYHQIRWIDESGHERVRIDFNNGKASPTPPAELQDKSGRYYFMETAKLNAGAVYVSPLDLNIEHAAPEFPHKPMLRVASPVFDSRGGRHGIVVLNYFGAELMARFEKARAEIEGHSLLLNPQGFWLNSPLPDKLRGFIFTPTTPSFSLQHPKIWKRINQTDHGQIEDAEGVWTFSTVYPNSDDNAALKSMPSANTWKIVSLLPSKTLYGNRTLFKPILAALLTLLLLEAIGCWKLAGNRQSRKQLQHELRQSNQNLQTLIAERTSQWEADVLLRELAENQLQLLNAALKAAANAIVITDSHSIIQWANPAFAALTGFPLEDAIGKYPKELIRSGLQSKAFYQALSISILSKRVWRGEIVNQHQDGFLYTESLTITPIGNHDSDITHFIAVMENISDRKQAETRLTSLTRVYTMLSNINQAIVHIRDIDMLLKEVCRIAVEDGGFNMAWIGLPDATGQTLFPAAFAGIDLETLEQFNNLPAPGAQDNYPANAAYNQACSVGSNDIEHDPRTKAWRHKALALGYRSVLALPINIKGEVRGVCSMYAPAANAFANQQIKLLNDMADNIAFALETAETEQRRRG